jgi:hypothetical protein
MRHTQTQKRNCLNINPRQKPSNLFVLVVFHLVDLTTNQTAVPFLTVLKDWHTGFRMRVTVWTFLKAESTVAFNC